MISLQLSSYLHSRRFKKNQEKRKKKKKKQYPVPSQASKTFTKSTVQRHSPHKMHTKMLATFLFALVSSSLAMAVPPAESPEYPTEPACEPQYICADYVNDCEKMYGGCFTLKCAGDPWPKFTPPACPADDGSAGTDAST